MTIIESEDALYDYLKCIFDLFFDINLYLIQNTKKMKQLKIKIKEK